MPAHDNADNFNTFVQHFSYTKVIHFQTLFFFNSDADLIFLSGEKLCKPSYRKKQQGKECATIVDAT